MDEVELSSRTVSHWWIRFRGVCQKHFRRHPIRLGVVVFMTSIICLCVRICVAVECVRESCGFSEVLNVDPICHLWFPPVAYIQRYVRPGTTIVTDNWRAYRQLTAPQHRRFMYRHLMINHNRYFVDPNGIHTQPIESKWGKWKEVRRMNGIRDRQIRSHLAEFNWRERFGAKKIYPVDD